MNTYLSFLFFSILCFCPAKTYTVLETDKIYISISNNIFLMNLVQNSITQELISILPLKTKFIGENSFQTTVSLTTELEIPNVLDNNIIEGNKGDVLLFKGKELIIFKEKNIISHSNNDYIKIGYIEDVEKLLNLIEKKKKFILWNSLNYENNSEKVKPYGYYTSLMNFLTWKIFTFICFILL